MPAFVMIHSRLVWWPVKVQVPLDGGGSETQDFEARFKLLGQDEYQAIYREHGPLAADKPLLRKVVVDWRGIAGADGDPLSHDEEALEALIDITCVRLALARAYVEAENGGPAKN